MNARHRRLEARKRRRESLAAQSGTQAEAVETPKPKTPTKKAPKKKSTTAAKKRTQKG